MEFQDIMTELSEVLSPERFQHTLGVLAWAEKMATRFDLPSQGINLEQVRLAALLHDCAKSLTDQQLIMAAKQAGIQLTRDYHDQPFLLHAPIGAIIAKKDYQLTDDLVLQAIARHTLGADQMTALDKVIFIADMVEVHRQYPGVEALRKLSLEDLEQALLAALNSNIKHLIALGVVIHPQTVSTRNALLRARIR